MDISKEVNRKEITSMTTISEVVKYTQDRVITWYENATIDYNVYGNAYVIDTDKEVSVAYTEEDVTKTFTLSKEELLEEDVDYLFNVWSELA